MDELVRYIMDHPEIVIPVAKKVWDKLWLALKEEGNTSEKDSFVLGYYLPWLVLARNLDDSVFYEDAIMINEIYTLEFYILEASNKLQLDIDKDYVYNIGSNPLIEKYSIHKKLSLEWEDKEEMAFALGCALSESIILFNDKDSRDMSIEEAADCARKIGREMDVCGLQNQTNLATFKEKIEEFATRYIGNEDET